VIYVFVFDLPNLENIAINRKPIWRPNKSVKDKGTMDSYK